MPDEEIRSGPFGTIERVGGFDAVLCLECGREDGSLVLARKGGAWLEVEAVGRAAHAGTEPERGRNPVLALAREAIRVAALHDGAPGLCVAGHVAARRPGGERDPGAGADAGRHPRVARGRPRADARGGERLGPARRRRDRRAQPAPRAAAGADAGQRAAGRTPRRRSATRSGTRSGTRAPAASRTSAGSPGRACRASTGSGRWAAPTTRRTSTSRWGRSRRGRAWSRACWPRSRRGRRPRRSAGAVRGSVAGRRPILRRPAMPPAAALPPRRWGRGGRGRSAGTRPGQSALRAAGVTRRTRLWRSASIDALRLHLWSRGRGSDLGGRGRRAQGSGARRPLRRPSGGPLRPA